MEKEHRKFKRFDAYMSVRYKANEPQRVTGISLSKDLSREGLKISSNEALRTGTVLNLEIDIPDDPKPVYSTAEVMWSKKVDGEQRNFEHGVRFLMMDPVDKFRVLDYAYNNWLETKVNDFADPEQLPEIR